MLILVSCGTSGGTTALTSVCSFVSAVDANELSTVPWTRAFSSLALTVDFSHSQWTSSNFSFSFSLWLLSGRKKRSPNSTESDHFLSFSEPLLGLLLQHPPVPDPLVVHHPEPDAVRQSFVFHHASACSSSSDRHISRTNTSSATTENHCRVRQYHSLCSCGCAALRSARVTTARCPGVTTLSCTAVRCDSGPNSNKESDAQDPQDP